MIEKTKKIEPRRTSRLRRDWFCSNPGREIQDQNVPSPVGREWDAEFRMTDTSNQSGGLPLS